MPLTINAPVRDVDFSVKVSEGNRLILPVTALSAESISAVVGFR
jgi:hypothetical protein